MNVNDNRYIDFRQNRDVITNRQRAVCVHCGDAELVGSASIDSPAG